MVLIEPTLLAILPPAERDTASKAFAKVIDVGEAEGALAAKRAAMERAGGDAWLRLDEEKQLSRLQRLAPVCTLVELCPAFSIQTTGSRWS